MSGGQDLRIGTFLLRGGRSKGGKGKGGKGKKGKKESYDLIVNIDLDEWKLTDEQVRTMQSWSTIKGGILPKKRGHFAKKIRKFLEKS